MRARVSAFMCVYISLMATLMSKETGHKTRKIFIKTLLIYHVFIQKSKLIIFVLVFSWAITCGHSVSPVSYRVSDTNVSCWIRPCDTSYNYLMLKRLRITERER